jgi:hypothetical protein
MAAAAGESASRPVNRTGSAAGYVEVAATRAMIARSMMELVISSGSPSCTATIAGAAYYLEPGGEPPRRWSSAPRNRPLRVGGRASETVGPA